MNYRVQGLPPARRASLKAKSQFGKDFFLLFFFLLLLFLFIGDTCCCWCLYLVFAKKSAP